MATLPDRPDRHDEALVRRSDPQPADLPRLGWKEQVVLPEWGVRMRAKLDTGARTSALHVEDVEEIGEHLHHGRTVPLARITLLVGSRAAPEHRIVEAPVVGHRRVRDTRARPELRPVIHTRIVCGPVDTEADITLTSRRGMNFRMLLGRLTLAGNCVVDPADGYLVTRTPPRPAADDTIRDVLDGEGADDDTDVDEEVDELAEGEMRLDAEASGSSAGAAGRGRDGDAGEGTAP
jgi:hypothetical protein